MRGVLRPRLLLLLPTSTYRTEAFVEAARSVGAELTVASELPSTFEREQPENLLTLDFKNHERAVAQAEEFHRKIPITAVLGVDDDTTVLAAVISQRLGLKHISVEAARAARDKRIQRGVLRKSGVKIPDFEVHHIRDSVDATQVGYPAVIKPVNLSASRGVIRINDAAEFESARNTVAEIIRDAVTDSEGPEGRYLIEQFIAGPEFAIEGVVVAGRLHVLALFDKPDPLDGPYFEETIYVTPSRYDEEVQSALVGCATEAVRALGITTGPVHAELRFREEPWVIEVAARSIGGRCSRVLEFEPGRRSLEHLLIELSLGLSSDVPRRSPGAAGVMMIPIRTEGILEDVKGVAAASDVAGITDIIITAHRGQTLIPPPYGSQYPGFIFARGASATFVE
ncbi:MAG: ATP-grasp domain-containing protein, partial [Gemmatimonadales bacterium]